MARKGDDLLDVLTELSWRVNLSIAAAVYVGLRFVVPRIHFSSAGAQSIAKTLSGLAWIAIIFVMTAGASALVGHRKRKLLDSQRGIQTIRALPWKKFEELIGEAYRRQGYSVTENAKLGADGGIDLVLRRDGNVYLVQCKRWRNWKVGVNVAREMLGLITDHNAHGAIIVTTGLFTQEARIFAAKHPIDLIEGHALVELIAGAQRSPGIPRASEPLRTCQRCGSRLLLKTARRGKRAGSQFWGCSHFPACRYAEDI